MKLAVFCSLFAGKSQAEDTHALYASYRCGESLGAVSLLTSHNARHGNASHAVSARDEMGRYSRRTSLVFGLAWGQRASMVVRGLGGLLDMERVGHSQRIIQNPTVPISCHAERRRYRGLPPPWNIAAPFFWLVELTLSPT